MLDCAHDVFLVVDMVCPQYVLYVRVTCECDYVPDRRFILVPWNVWFCKSFVGGVLQCEFDACLSGCNQRYGLEVFCGKCFACCSFRECMRLACACCSTCSREWCMC